MTPEYILFAVIGSVFASSGFWSIILYLMQRGTKKRELEACKEDLNREANIALLHDRIYEIVETAIERGWTTFEEYDNLTGLYTIYKKIGGNGTGKDFYDTFKTLPKRSTKSTNQNLTLK